jgi:hypothetical protein
LVEHPGSFDICGALATLSRIHLLMSALNFAWLALQLAILPYAVVAKRLVRHPILHGHLVVRVGDGLWYDSI